MQKKILSGTSCDFDTDIKNFRVSFAKGRVPIGEMRPSKNNL